MFPQNGRSASKTVRILVQKQHENYLHGESLSDNLHRGVCFEKKLWVLGLSLMREKLKKHFFMWALHCADFFSIS
jgi:hypothetical protein